MKWSVCIVGAAVLAQTAAAAPSVERPIPPRDALPQRIDAIVARQLTQRHIAGATVAVVQNGTLIFAKGYGYADATRRVPVMADRTLFRIGSVSKIFTTVATMQLAEAGKLRLDADIARYLDFKIPRVSAMPITLTHLMTHTAGFAESLDGLLVKAPRDVLPVGALVKRTLPPLVRAPGVAPSYSNHAIALEGYIVERASGERFEDYVDRHILRPLGMRHSSAREPLPGPLTAQVARGHLFEAGRLVPQPFELTNMAPAGSISATATDMARFMIANLQLGTIDGVQILRPATARTMQACHYRTDPRAACMGYGFYHQRLAGHDVIAHDGGTNFFASNMVLVPSAKLGIFVSYNSPGGGALLDELPRAVTADRLGARDLPAATPVDHGDDVADYAGAYRTTRRIQHGWLTILGLATDDVSVIGPHRLRFGDEIWQQIDAGWFRAVSPKHRDQTLIFERDAASRVAALYLGNLPPVKLDRVPGYATLGAAQAVLGGFVAASLAFAAWAVAARRRWWRSPSRTIVAAIAIGTSCTLVGAALLIGLSVTLESAGYGPPPAARGMIALFDVGATAFVAATVLLGQRRRTIGQGWRGTAVMLAALASAVPLYATLWYCNLLGYPG